MQLEISRKLRVESFHRVYGTHIKSFVGINFVEYYGRTKLARCPPPLYLHISYRDLDIGIHTDQNTEIFGQRLHVEICQQRVHIGGRTIYAPVYRTYYSVAAYNKRVTGH